jgi:hypothetical protein
MRNLLSNRLPPSFQPVKLAALWATHFLLFEQAPKVGHHNSV